MNSNEQQRCAGVMPFGIRPLGVGDIAQSAEIEQDAFPTLFPPTSFRRELKNSMAKYLVAWSLDDIQGRGSVSEPASYPQRHDGGRPLIGRILSNTRQLWPRRGSAWEIGKQFLAGFVGIWYMVDETHIVSVGVRRDYRGRGIGELLLLAAVEQALVQGARTVTLEVRVSNHVARNLYLKYGFTDRGIRRGYYVDDREDAVIMTTDPIDRPPYRDRLATLKQAFEQRWGHAERILD